MARVPEESFGEGTQLVRVYLAAALAEAQAVEGVLDAAGIDYLAEPEQYGAPAALGARVRTGVGFWVTEERLAPAAEALERAGRTAGLVERASSS
jgi:hypothetical protein